jgi:hypothetical protein
MAPQFFRAKKCFNWKILVKELLFFYNASMEKYLSTIIFGSMRPSLLYKQKISWIWAFFKETTIDDTRVSQMLFECESEKIEKQHHYSLYGYYDKIFVKEKTFKSIRDNWCKFFTPLSFRRFKNLNLFSSHLRIKHLKAFVVDQL